MTTDHTTHVNGLRLHHREWGDPLAPPVLVLHGIMGHSREWDVLTAALAERFHVFAVDQRGHGESAWAPDYSVDALAADLVGLVRRVAVAPVRLVGHSLGGMASLVTTADRPDLVERLVLVDVGPETLSSPWGRDELPGMLSGLAETSYADPRDAVDEWLEGDPLAREPLVRHYVTHCLVRGADGRWHWRFDGHGLARQAVTGFVTEARLWDAVDRVRVPTLLVRGEHSTLLTRDAADRTVRRLADGRLVEITGGGHDLGVERPEAVTDAVRAFLDPAASARRAS